MKDLPASAPAIKSTPVHTIPGRDSPQGVVIIGGGVAGAMLALHLARAIGPGGPAITVIEPRAALGRGLAYSTDDPDHRLNVPHLRMSLDASAPGDYADWLAAHAPWVLQDDSVTEGGAVFTTRAVYGAYLSARIAPALAAGRIRHLRGRAVSARRLAGGGWQIGLADGQSLRAARLVLAASHPAPCLPKGFAALAGHAALIPDAYAPAALDRPQRDEAVLILGAGLTAADIIASLVGRGHRGPIRLLSRNGRLPQPHGPAQPVTSADFTRDPAQSARALLRRIRAEVARDAAQGLTWHAVFDGLRKQGPQIWAQLALVERARLLRHLRGLWDMHRFRIAPQTLAALRAAEATGQVQRLAGRPAEVRIVDGAAQLTLRLRTGGLHHVTADRVILATGPAHGTAVESNPLYADLGEQGVIAADALGLGLATGARGHALDAMGRVQDDVFIAGPLARATVGELMGLPEVVAWSAQIARTLAEDLTALPMQKHPSR